MSENDLWICSTDGKEKLVIQCVQSVVTAYEVRRLASTRLGVDPMAVDIRLVKNTDLPSPSKDQLPDWRGLTSICRRPDIQTILESADFVEVRWTGNDYGHGGGLNRRRLQTRSTGTKEWTDA